MSDKNKYMGIGATVFFTGVLAFFSSGYALYIVFESWWAAVEFGLVWGLMIFNLDRYIVLSMKSYGKWWRDLTVALPRVVLAVLLALVISKERFQNKVTRLLRLRLPANSYNPAF